MIGFQNKVPAGVGMEQFEFPLQVGLITSISCRGKSTHVKLLYCCQMQKKKKSALKDRLIETYPSVFAFKCLCY